MFVNVDRKYFEVIDIFARTLYSYGTEPWCSAGQCLMERFYEHFI